MIENFLNEPFFSFGQTTLIGLVCSISMFILGRIK